VEEQGMFKMEATCSFDE